MRKLLLILFFLPLRLFATDYYVAAPPLGNDGNNGLSQATPWATLSHGCTHAVNGDDINIMTDITDNTSAYPAVGVNIYAYGGEIKTITTNVVTCYLIYTSVALTDGNQILDHIAFNGNNRTGYRAVDVIHRNHVEIRYCTFEDFEWAGVHFDNEISWTQEPLVYADGNSFHDCTITNCTSRIEGRDEQGLLRFDGQVGFKCYNNVFDQTERTIGLNGTCIDWSFVKAAEVYNNEFFKNDSEGGTWNFVAENWNTQGGCIVHDNVFHGAAAWDQGGPSNIKDEYGFCLKFYRNTMTANSYPLPRPGHETYGIVIEGGNQDFYVYQNSFDGFAVPIEIGTSTLPTNYVMHNIWIYANEIKNVNYSNYSEEYGILLISEGNGYYTNTWDSIFVVNNSFYGGPYNNRYGIYWNCNGNVSNSLIANNIVHSFDDFAVMFVKQTEDPDPCVLTNVDVIYNDFYNNGTDGIYVDAAISRNPANSDFTTGQRTDDPKWETLNDFRLDSTSLCIAHGVAVSYHSQFTAGGYDFSNAPYNTPPSIGSREFGTPIVPPIIVPYPVGLLKYNGRLIKYHGRLMRIQ